MTSVSVDDSVSISTGVNIRIISRVGSRLSISNYQY